MDYTKNIEKTKKYIEEHLSEELSAEIIAAEVGYSVFHYCRIFKEYEGISLMSYVREKRLELAKAEIENGSAIGDIAVKYGFETASGFSRAYKRKFGARPGKIG